MDAKSVGGMIKDFGLEKRVGDFGLDNACDDNTAVGMLEWIFGLSLSKRWLRCTTHIVRLVAT